MTINIKAVTTFRQDNLKQNSRLEWVDYAKGVGIVLVVYGHVLREIRPVKGLFSDYADFFDRSDRFIYSFHMPLFFILSGYFFMSSLYKKDFVFDKLKTLAYPFIIWSVLQTLAEVLISYLSPYTNTKTQITELITCIIVPRDQFWFLYALFFITLINYLLFRINVALGLYFSVGLWLTYILLRQFVPATFNNTFQFLIFFDVGIVLSQTRRFINAISSVQILLVNVVFFAVTEFFYLSGNSLFNSTLPLKLLVGISGAVLVIQLSRAAVEGGFLLLFNYIGKRSLPVYLAHMLVASGTRIILLKIFKINSLPVNCIAGTLAGVFLPIFLYNIAKKSEYTSWLFTFPQKSAPNNILKTNSVVHSV